jgi:hypothetical protein
VDSFIAERVPSKYECVRTFIRGMEGGTLSLTRMVLLSTNLYRWAYYWMRSCL